MRFARLSAILLLVWLACGTAVLARPGGGETYSSGSGSSSDSSGDSGDGEIAATALLAVLELCIRYPKVGIPLVVVVLGFLAFSGRSRGGDHWESIRRATHDDEDPPPLPARPSLDQLRTLDPDFSSVLFEDFVFRLYATAQTSRGVGGRLDELAPYLSSAARRALAERRPAGQPVTNVVIGKMSVSRVSVPAPEQTTGEFAAYVKVGVQFEANYTVGSDPGSRRFVVEDWLLRRAASVRTKAPDPERRFPCPNCGAPWRAEAAAGTQKCAFCGAIVDNGRFDWQVEAIDLRRESDDIPGLDAEVVEQGTSLPTIVDPRLAADWTAFTQEDPGVTDATIAARLGYIYTTVNDAWSLGDLAPARPALSDGLADYLQYWIDAYGARGLRNVLDDMRLTRRELVRLARDRHYDALTIRIWATGKDYVVRTTDPTEVVRGRRDQPRDYSEYWTLIRASARRGAPRADASCGSCGAALTVTMAGRCDHCGAHVTAGEFDWVLSKIEQDDAYRG